jgi:hypothetical protein
LISRLFLMIVQHLWPSVARRWSLASACGERARGLGIQAAVRGSAAYAARTASDGPCVARRWRRYAPTVVVSGCPSFFLVFFLPACWLSGGAPAFWVRAFLPRSRFEAPLQDPTARSRFKIPLQDSASSPQCKIPHRPLPAVRLSASAREGAPSAGPKAHVPCRRRWLTACPSACGSDRLAAGR